MLFPEVHRNPLLRFYGRKNLHFITFSCYRRLPLLGSPLSRDCFVEAMAIERKRCRFLLLGYVVMPEHVHLVISEPERFSPSKLMQVLKQRVSANLAAIHPGRAFWQRRFYDFNVWSERKLSEKLDYIHGNPIKRGLVEHPRDWPWSSWSNYVEGRGLIDVDMVNVARGAAPGLEKSKPAPF